LNNLHEKIAIVTGASSGIGRATAIQLARAGATVVLASRNEAALQSIEKEVLSLHGKACVVATDVTNLRQIEGLVEKTLQEFGRVDILVCNAGIYPRGRVRDLTFEDYERCMSVNFYGALHLIRRVLPHMLQRAFGHIVVVSSVDGRKGLPMDAAYVSSKYAITGFMDVLRQELRGSGVHATTILPGRVDTPMIAALKVPAISAKISSGRVGRTVVRAIRRNRGEVIVPFLGPKTLLVLSSISPGLGDLLVRFFRLEGKEESM
jgi:NAD(P)-dependent dehydrogenase (short-subunit alcohol dehydrogenase family)